MKVNKKPFDCITDFIFVENKPSKADVILVPGGSKPQLMEKAVKLFNEGFSSYILPSGGKNPKLTNEITEWDYLKSMAISLGVSENAILKEDQAKHTFDNANFSWKVLIENNIEVNKAILVCKAHHSRRALLTYQTVFKNVEFIVVPIVDEKNITKDNWFLDQKKIDVVMMEVEKIGNYFGKHISKYI